MILGAEFEKKLARKALIYQGLRALFMPLGTVLTLILFTNNFPQKDFPSTFHICYINYTVTICTWKNKL